MGKGGAGAPVNGPAKEAMRDELRTERLLLRRWRESDRLPFQQMNADPRVMEFFPESLIPEASDALFNRAQQHFDKHGFGPFAVELLDNGSFIGFIGLSIPAFEAHFMPAVEIGWRLAFNHWGKGLATEGARAAHDFGLHMLRLEQVVSFTVPANVRSRRVMERLGMTHDPADDFEHPALPAGHPLRRHVLYRGFR
jgi:RimJ/RimL family protein N-acetyltransferase